MLGERSAMAGNCPMEANYAPRAVPLVRQGEWPTVRPGEAVHGQRIMVPASPNTVRQPRRAALFVSRAYWMLSSRENLRGSSLGRFSGQKILVHGSSHLAALGNGPDD